MSLASDAEYWKDLYPRTMYVVRGKRPKPYGNVQDGQALYPIDFILFSVNMNPYNHKGSVHIGRAR